MQETQFDPWVGKIPWRRKWQPTPLFLPGESHGGRSLIGYSPRGSKESDMTSFSLSWSFQVFEELAFCFPQQLQHFIFPPVMQRVPIFPQAHHSFLSFLLKNSHHSTGCEVVSVILICISLIISAVTSFHKLFTCHH